MLKKWAYVILIGLLIILAWAAVTNINYSYDGRETTQLTLNDRAVKEFEPEVAVVTMGVETTNEDLNQAFAENNNKMDIVVNRLNNIEGINVKTLNYRIDTRSRLEKDVETNYYYVQNLIEVRTEKINELGSIIQQAVDSGVNQLQSIDYLLKNKEEATRQVTSEAINSIKEKAGFVSRETGYEGYLVKNLNINDQVSVPDYYPQLKMEAAAAIPPISPGKIEITVTVNGTFELK